MSSAVGPFAVDEGLVSAPNDGEVLVRIFNTNSGKIIHSRFAMRDGEAVVTGEVGLPGISMRGAPVRLDFLDPAGTTGRGLLPTGSAMETLEIEPGLSIEASLIDAAIPSVFVRADDLGVAADIMPDAMDADTALMGRLEHIRQQASVKMGLADDLSAAAARIAVPKIALIGPATAFHTLSGDQIASTDHDLCVRMVSAGQAHRAFPITGSLALASAAAVRDSTVAKCLEPGADLSNLRLGTPSGVIAVGAQVDAADGKSIPVIGSASILRTQRRLFEGRITIPDPNHTP